MRKAIVLLTMLMLSVGLSGSVTSSAAAPQKAAPKGAIQRATIVINGGYSPDTITVEAGRPVELTFVRKETSGCGDVVQFPSLGLKRSLKTGQKAVITFTPKKAETVSFTCGMNMYRGQVVVREHRR
jgi:plastocyanin domain-containing protein